MSGLHSAQISHYREQGFVVVPGVINDDEIERYRLRAREIALGDVPEEAEKRLVRDIHYARGGAPLPEDPERALWKILNPDRFDPVMAECLRFPRVLDAAQSLIGEDILAFLMMFIYKPPGVPQSVHPFHQDAVFFPFEPQQSCVGVWIPLDPVSEENGTLCVVPGSHRLDVRKHELREGINFGAVAAQGVEGNEQFHEEAVAMEMSPGDCLLFNTRLLHRSGGNRTERHRRVITLHLASARCRPTGRSISEYGFNLVRGRLHEGCLQPVEVPPLAMYNALKSDA
jgi:phytanoyl-CoA hydroxylase